MASFTGQASALALKSGNELDHSHSDQTPSGTVRLTANEFEPIVDAIARELSRQ